MPISRSSSWMSIDDTASRAASRSSYPSASRRSVRQRASRRSSSSPGAKLAGYVTDACFYARDAGSATRAAGIAAKMSAYALAGDVDDPLASERLASERAWQAAWLVEQLGLRPD